MAAFSTLGALLSAVAEVALAVAAGIAVVPDAPAVVRGPAAVLETPAVLEGPAVLEAAAVLGTAAVLDAPVALETPVVVEAATRVVPGGGADPAFSAAWYRATLFSSYHEVHAFQLGVYGGILALALRARGYRHAATAALLGLFVFSLGLPDVYDLCRRTGEACGSLPVQLKPWYFLTGLLGTAVVGPRATRGLRAAARRLLAAPRRLRSPAAAPRRLRSPERGPGRRRGAGSERDAAEGTGDAGVVTDGVPTTDGGPAAGGAPSTEGARPSDD